MLSILQYPDERLHTVATPIEEITEEVKTMAADMAETMYASNGIGLAATQVNYHKRMIVIDVSETRDKLMVFINPVILDRRGEVEGQEGCLSVPGIYEKVTRSEWVKVKAMGLDGKEFEIETDGLLAICIQHEIDHIDGKVFVEYLSRFKLDRIVHKLRKMEKMKD